MPDQSSLDPQVILASLDIHDASRIEPLTGGFDTAIWRVDWQGTRYALRVFRPEQVETSQREMLAMQVAHQAGIPVPQVIRSGLWQDRPVLLLSWVKGKTLAAVVQSQPRYIRQLGLAFGQMQATIHRVTPPLEMDSTHWIEWAGDEPELKARLYDLPSRKTALIHLDYHPLNVMAEGGHITGVLDWANARAGDPRADFARTYAILRIEPYGSNGDSLPIAFARRILAYFWRAGYGQAGGQLDEMALFYAWAGASMIRDQAHRVNNPDFWLKDHHLDPVRRWRDHWKRKAGIRV